MTNHKHPPEPAPEKEYGNFNRRYAVPLIFVGSIIFTVVIITLAGMF